MFDFDGTVAIVRAGWMPIMLDMIMETIGPLAEDREAAAAEAEEYVARFTGKDTVHQMVAFAEHVQRLGGRPVDPVERKSEFLRRIENERAARLAEVSDGRRNADDLLVPGTRALLENLRSAGIALYLASGTAHADIVYETELLDIDHYFHEIHGSSAVTKTKRELLAHLVGNGFAPDEIVTFGDGRVEIEETKLAGGTAVGVATCEPDCLVTDTKKRRWLMQAGADYIVPNFLEPEIRSIIAGTF